MELDKHIRDNAARRESFMALAERVFGLSFKEWYAGGWWSERYRPYVLAHGDRVLACIAVNVMDTAWRGKDRRYIQLGTVMTDPACRGQGLSRRQGAAAPGVRSGKPLRRATGAEQFRAADVLRRLRI